MAGSAVLAYDIRGERRFTSVLADEFDEATLAAWLGPAPAYGIHATIAAGILEFDERDLGEVDLRLSWLASRLAPFALEGGRFHDAFPMRPRVLVGTYDSPDGALSRLERHVLTLISPLRAGSGYDARRNDYDEGRRRVLDRHGDPNAAEYFIPHWSLATNLPDEAAWLAVRSAIAARTGLFGDPATRAQDVDELHLVRRGDGGFYSIAASYRLRGSGNQPSRIASKDFLRR